MYLLEDIIIVWVWRMIFVFMLKCYNLFTFILKLVDIFIRLCYQLLYLLWSTCSF